ncbi:MAG TPA: dual specificity protein phosphatase 23 [Candidatus Nitrosocosmicus sp.]|nr:dual specificity protein phosphatase 23 [Candidatus Nitrosocosmicus sp.]
MTRIGEIYRRVHGRFVERPTNFSWVIPQKLAGSGLPSSYDQLTWLASNGIKTLVTVREIPLPEIWIQKVNSQNYELENHFLKTDDYDAPTIDEIHRVVDYIEKKIERNRPVLVHCAAGKGRTGTILAAYLIKKDGMTPQEAVKKLRLMRPGSVQSERQSMAIEHYYKFLNQ